VVYSKQRVVIRSKRPLKPQSLFPLGWTSDTRWREGLANPQLLRTCCKRETPLPLPLIEQRSSASGVVSVLTELISVYCTDMYCWCWLSSFGPELGFPYNCFNYLPVTIRPPRCTRPHPSLFQRVPCSHSFHCPKDNGLCKTDPSADGTLHTRFRYLAELNPRRWVVLLLKGCHRALSEIYLSNIKNYNSSVI
jgi:hypothetical protein